MLYSETELKKRLKSGRPVFYFYASDEALVRSAAAKAEKFLSEEAPRYHHAGWPHPQCGGYCAGGGHHLVLWRTLAGYAAAHSSVCLFG